MPDAFVDVFSFIVDLKDVPTTFISKKLNPTRRALVTEKIIGPLAKSANTKEVPNVAEDISGVVQLFSVLPEVMWEFIKDDDKTKIGSFSVFADGLDDDNSIDFVKWCAAKLTKMNRFLEQNGQTAPQ